MDHTLKSQDLCLVTGVSGYLASWLAKDLLEQGVRVRGTIRSLGDQKKVETLTALLPGVELVAADLRAQAGWADAIRDCRFAFHVASPQAVSSEKDRTGGAVKGTDFMIRAALASETVEKIVVTSSEAAIAYGHPTAKQHFTERDWTQLTGAVGKADYFRSKTLAEKRAWDLVADPALNLRHVALSTINPGMILGPSLVPWGRFSLDFIRSIAEGRMPLIPDMVIHVVDVRDCARMHIALMDNPSTSGHRHFAFSTAAKMTDIARVIAQNYGSRGYNPRTNPAPAALMWLLQFVSNDVASIYSKLGKPNCYQTLWPDVFQYEYRDLTKVVCSSMDSMINHGWITG